MKKGTIWTLVIVMSIAFAGLINVEVVYMEKMIKMRNEQFAEIVSRSLHGVSMSLQLEETRHYLEEDLNESYDYFTGAAPDLSYDLNTQGAQNLNLPNDKPKADNAAIVAQAPKSGYAGMQEKLKQQYRYQKGLLNEVILNILSQSSDRPIKERADSAVVRASLEDQFARNGLTLPFEFAVVNRNNSVIYATENFDEDDQVFAQTLFPKDPVNKLCVLKVTFPAKNKYIHNFVKFMFPALVLTVILIVIFLVTIMLVFRQKKLSEMKNDFINNMTHELKTPISSISLAAQMLKDSAVTKSPVMMAHISSVINDETKRLRMHVEKVLTMSMLDRNTSTLRFQEVDASQVIESVINTFNLKVQKFGGSIEAELLAEDSIVSVDEMHFTNVIYNLLENAVKYRKEDEAPILKVSTANPDDSHLQITVEDNGIGIKKEDLKRIFERFYRVNTGNRHDVKGFGLGLAYVYKITHDLHGSIVAESDYGKGSRFIITLPIIK
ncbi:MAG: HAMP domain-containing histidine kinase [Muribaculaceae bacterium]|nr:HAMP domain-containing histidine kinase [Muribaculaceae bacterium]